MQDPISVVGHTWLAVQERLSTIKVDVDDYPLPEAEVAPESNGQLYNSQRDYLDQIAAYQVYQNGGEEAV
jgi:hypothetical protein